MTLTSVCCWFKFWFLYVDCTLAQEDKNKGSVSRIDLWDEAHKKRNGDYVNDNVQRLMVMLGLVVYFKLVIHSIFSVSLCCF